MDICSNTVDYLIICYSVEEILPTGTCICDQH